MDDVDRYIAIGSLLDNYEQHISTRDAEIARLRGGLERVEKAARAYWAAIADASVDDEETGRRERALRSALDDHGGE